MTNPAIPKYQPECLNLWDRFFNRYRREVYQRGTTIWCKKFEGRKLQGTDYSRSWIEYLVIDRLTGSTEIEKRYID